MSSVSDVVRDVCSVEIVNVSFYTHVHIIEGRKHDYPVSMASYGKRTVNLKTKIKIHSERIVLGLD